MGDEAKPVRPFPEWSGVKVPQGPPSGTVEERLEARLQAIEGLLREIRTAANLVAAMMLGGALGGLFYWCVVALGS